MHFFSSAKLRHDKKRKRSDKYPNELKRENIIEHNKNWEEKRKRLNKYRNNHSLPIFDKKRLKIEERKKHRARNCGIHYFRLSDKIAGYSRKKSRYAQKRKEFGNGVVN